MDLFPFNFIFFANPVIVSIEFDEDGWIFSSRCGNSYGYSTEFTNNNSKKNIWK